MRNQFPKEHYASQLILEILVRHLDGRKVERGETANIDRKMTTRLAMFGLLRLEPPNSPDWEFSVMTNRGREALGLELANYAEILHRAEMVADDRRGRYIASAEERKAIRFSVAETAAVPADTTANQQSN